MNNIKNKIYSIKTALILILIYAVMVAVATFIENDYGTATSKSLIYNSNRFNILHMLLIIVSIGVFLKYKMFSLKKLAVITFHIGFVVVIIGAGVTRFISFEGIMHIREGETTNKMLDTKASIIVNIKNSEYLYNADIPIDFNEISNNDFTEDYEFDNQVFSVKLKEFIPNAAEMIVEDKESGIPIVNLMYLQGESRLDIALKYGERKIFAGQEFCFGVKSDSNSVNLDFINNTLLLSVNDSVSYMEMSDTSVGGYPANFNMPLVKGRMFSWTNNKIILTHFIAQGTTKIQTSSNPEMSPMNALVFDVTKNSWDSSQELIVYGASGYNAVPSEINLDGYKFSIAYGPKEIELPISIKLNDFVMTRYPGSESPSSYESHINLISENRNTKHKIFMNSVLDVDGYRFFQSSYDTDEMGTILSVNHDTYGTLLTYLGYFLLSLGMALSLFSKNTRFRKLGTKLKELEKTKIASIIILLMLFSSTNVFSQETKIGLPIIDASHAEKFGNLQAQTEKGRMKPVNSVSSEILLKLTRRSTFGGQNSNQIYISMMLRPDLWARTPMIKVKHPELKKLYNAVDGKVALINLFSDENEYIPRKFVDAAYQKAAGKRDKFDKDVIKLDEQVSIFYQVLGGSFLNIYPIKGDANNKWTNVTVLTEEAFENSNEIMQLHTDYLDELESAIISDYWGKADLALEKISDYQKQLGSKVLISDTKLQAEVYYNNWQIFRHLFEFYFIIGLFYLFFLIGKLIFTKIKLNLVEYGVRYLIFIAFAAQTFGLGLRWYISGHAPWSDGYESMIYISWATMLAGIIFSKQNKIALAATSLLSGVILLVAHLSWIDPEITNLVPVLKSYWLTIHVAIITASYGFLGLSAILGFINLFLMVIKSDNSAIRLNINIKEISYINEKSIIIGLYLLTIGTFLGGVWANESWGRYWGWDPKETWALITVLIYAVIAHLHLIPKLKGLFVLNFLSLISFSSVMMTYFGVNFYLSGLHSYAKGDPVPVPSFVYYTFAVIFVLSVIAFAKNKKLPVE